MNSTSQRAHSGSLTLSTSPARLPCGRSARSPGTVGSWAGLVTLAIIAAVLPAAELDLSKLPPASDQKGLTYDKDIKPLFEASCVNCHGERRQRAGLRLDSLQAVLTGSDEGKVITPGDSKGSGLVHAVAQIDPETAMPPKRRGGGPGGFGGPGGPGGGPGGPGGPGGRAGGGGAGGAGGAGGRGGGFSPGGLLAPGLFTEADQNKDKKVTRSEFAAVADAWWPKLDTLKEGKLTQAKFAQHFEQVMPPIEFGGGGGGGGGGRGPGGQRGGNEGMGFNIGRMLAPGFFAAVDGDKDGSLTQGELKGTFEKWFSEWDTEKTGGLGDQQFRDGLAAAMPRLDFGGGRGGPGGGPGAGGGGRGPGGPGGGGGGGLGGLGGFGFGRTALAQQMVTQADKNKDEKLSKAEFVGLTDAWFDKLDPSKSGKVSQEQFVARLDDALELASADGGARAGASVGAGLFAAVDSNKDGSLGRAELKSTFEEWFAKWDTDKSGSLTQDTLYAGLSEAIPRQGFGGFGGGGAQGGAGGAAAGGPGAPGGFGGFGGFGGGNAGPAPKPLTPEQVGLVRAWIDQGAK